MAAAERKNGAAAGRGTSHVDGMAGAAAPAGHVPHQPINKEPADLDYLRLNLLALQRVLIDKGLVTYQEVLREIHKLDTVDHHLGAQVVAHAWTDPEFKRRLLADGKAACAELDVKIGGYDELQVVENTDRVHHVVVCTTCSCTPAPLHGITPDWYKSAAYRTRVVAEPRAVLQEFGLNLPDEVDVRVVDTSTTHRCLVLPKRPPNSEGLSEDELASLVTPESLFGVGQALGPVGV
jgi:nitrile hydratase